MNSGSSVSTPKGLLPFFLTGLSPSRNWLPLADTLGELCPGTVLPPLLMQLIAGIPLASITTDTSWLPSPVSVPFAISEPSEKLTPDNLMPGPAETGDVRKAAIRKMDRMERNFFFISLLYYLNLVLESPRECRIIFYNQRIRSVLSIHRPVFNFMVKVSDTRKLQYNPLWIFMVLYQDYRILRKLHAIVTKSFLIEPE